MGIRHDVEKGLEKYKITKIDGQPTDEDLNLLAKELTNAAGSIATKMGVESMATLEWLSKMPNASSFPGVVPVFRSQQTPDHTQQALTKTRSFASAKLQNRKAEIVEYETYLGVENYLCRMIVKSLDHKWLAEVESKTVGFNHLSPKALLSHLRNVGGSLDHMDVTELISNIHKPWDGNETPAAHFARGDKYERQLLKVGQAKKTKLQLAFALSTFQSSGEFEPALHEWEAKIKADQTFVNFRVFVQKEFGKHNKQTKTTAKSVGHGIANSITDKEVEQIEQLEAQALFVAELANSMQEQSQKQFKETMELFNAKLDTKSLPYPSNPKGGEGNFSVYGLVIKHKYHKNNTICIPQLRRIK